MYPPRTTRCRRRRRGCWEIARAILSGEPSSYPSSGRLKVADATKVQRSDRRAARESYRVAFLVAQIDLERDDVVRQHAEVHRIAARLDGHLVVALVRSRYVDDSQQRADGVSDDDRFNDVAVDVERVGIRLVIVGVGFSQF